MQKLKELADRIYKFIDTYAGIRPDWDEQYDLVEEKYTLPDASCLRACADRFKCGEIPKDVPNTSWESCGYKPYDSKEGRLEHDMLFKEIAEIINLKNKIDIEKSKTDNKDLHGALNILLYSKFGEVKF